MTVTYARAQATRSGQAGTACVPNAIAERSRLALVLAILLAFCFQTSVTQTHFHPRPGATAGAATGGQQAVAGLVRKPVRPDTPASCPLCRELTHAGHFLPGSPPAILPLVVGIPVAPVRSDGIAGGGPRRSHFWYGRGPPPAVLVP